MKLKIYSLMFCALLASTFIHEIRAASALKLIERKKRSADPELNSNTECTGDPPLGSNGTLSIFANVDANTLAIVNLTVNVALILDINNNYIVLVNGDTGSAVVINAECNNGGYIRTGVWEVEEETFNDFLDSRTCGWSSSLKHNADVEFEVAEAPAEVLEAVNGVIGFLFDIGVELEVDPEVGLQFSIVYGTTIIGHISGLLQGYVELIASTDGIIIQKSLAGSYSVFKALSIIYGSISGGINGAIKAGADLKLQDIADAGSGLNYLSIIILQLGTKVDLGTDLECALNNVDSFLELAALLGGMGNTGVSGLFKVLHRAVQYTERKISTEAMANTFVQFLAESSQRDNEYLSADFNASLSTLLGVVEQINASGSLSGLVKTVRALQNGKLEIRGVNLSRIISHLITGVSQGTSNLLKVLVTVTLELSPIIGETLALLSSLMALILDVNSAIGIQLLRELDISVDVDLKNASGSLIASILKPVPNLAYKLRTENLYEVLTELPVFGDIVTDFDEALRCVTSKSVEHLLNSSIYFQNLIKGLFQLLTKLPLEINKNSVTHARELLNNCTSVNFYHSINSTLVIGVDW